MQWMVSALVPHSSEGRSGEEPPRLEVLYRYLGTTDPPSPELSACVIRDYNMKNQVDAFFSGLPSDPGTFNTIITAELSSGQYQV